MTHFMSLNPRELESLMQPVAETATNYNANTVRMLQAKVNQGFLELSEAEFQRVRRARRDWKSGYERALQSVLDADQRG